MQVLTYRGKAVSIDDVAVINKLIADNPKDSRRALSVRLCHLWGWTQANGHTRDMVCRGLMLALHRAGHISLPPPRRFSAGRRSVVGVRRTIQTDTTPLNATVRQTHPLRIVQVRRTPAEKLYADLVAQHHYLGYTQPVGEHLKYVIFSNERPIACCAFSSSPRHIGCRDRFIGWDAKTRRSNIHLISYNTRYLVLPWVNVRHLASHLLSLIAKRISGDWQSLYRHPLYFLETFVDTERFAGTCYKAANWTYMGLTTGRGKNDQTGRANRSIKAVWGYPLRKDYREKLTSVHG
jgi:hypothetical protein